MQPIQPQFDIVAAISKGGAGLVGVIQQFSQVIQHCYKEDVQALVLPPLERLGAWLMVDPDRLGMGAQALNNIPQPKIWDWRSISILIGLGNKGDNSGSSFSKAVACSHSLVGSFLFLLGCTSCFSTDMAAKLIHELLRLTGALRDYGIPETLVRQVADAMHG